MKEFADDKYKFEENGRKLSKLVENTVEKGEIARYEWFLLFPLCFQKACFPGASKGVIVWEWVNAIDIANCQFFTTMPELWQYFDIFSGNSQAHKCVFRNDDNYY